ncbi:hypothetical protein [Synechococcus sp. A15-24]|uniref:hypothetical protein n=1 Tax=Synechococcus sp. A15-24 TaxID=1050635 RepID=UPI001647D0F8|nr:hypothetical protein [Synechococcus sp. A15-24]
MHRTHWLLSHRINAVSSTVVIRFHPRQRDEITLLLERCFIEPVADSGLEQALAAETRITDITHSSSFQQALRSGVICGSVLLIDSILAIPPLGLGLVATMLSLPLLREFIEQVKERLKGEVDSRQLLPPASVEVALSAMLIGSGLARESLVEGLLGSSTSALQSISENTDGSSSEFFVFLERIKTSVMLRCVGTKSEGSSLCPIGDVQVGQRYRLIDEYHVYLPSRVVQGELVVINSLSDGSPLPFHVIPGDFLAFGAFVLSGDGICEVVQPFSEIAAFQIEDTLLEEEPLSVFQQRLSSLYDILLPPVQLGFGVWSLLNGLTERAIGLLAFNPAEDSEHASLSSAESALVDMALNNVHISDSRVLDTLSDVSHVLVSVDAMRHLGSYSYEQNLSKDASGFGCDLLQILWAIVSHLGADPSSVFWGILSDVLEKHPTLQSLEVNLGESDQGLYHVVLEGQPKVLIRFEEKGESIHALFSTSDASLGGLTIVWRPSPEFESVMSQLCELGIAVSTVGSHSGRTREPQDRKSKLHELQKNGSKVAYLGDVVNDIAAMAAADVAIGFSEDEKGFISKTVCDVILGGDIHWLSRLFVLSRNYVQSNHFNTNLIVVSSILLAAASFAATFSPLQTIVLFNAAPVIAEINTLRSLNFSRTRS